MNASILWFVFLVLSFNAYAHPQQSTSKNAGSSAPAAQGKNEAPSAAQPAPPKNAAEDRARRKTECADCVSVLLSRLEPKTRTVYDNERTLAQARRLEEDLKLAEAGKAKPRLWYTAFRENAQYNIVWTVTLIPSTTPQTVDVWATVQELPSGRNLYETWHRSTYWEKDHPDEKCLVDALTFLRSRRVTPSGVSFTKPAHSDSADPSFASPREAR